MNDWKKAGGKGVIVSPFPNGLGEKERHSWEKNKEGVCSFSISDQLVCLFSPPPLLFPLSSKIIRHAYGKGEQKREGLVAIFCTYLTYMHCHPVVYNSVSNSFTLTGFLFSSRIDCVGSPFPLLRITHSTRILSLHIIEAEPFPLS